MPMDRRFLLSIGICARSEEHTSELQSHVKLVCRLLLEKKKIKTYNFEGVNPDGYFLDKLERIPSALPSFQKFISEERFSRHAEIDFVSSLLLEKIDNPH